MLDWAKQLQFFWVASLDTSRVWTLSGYYFIRILYSTHCIVPIIFGAKYHVELDLQSIIYCSTVVSMFAIITFLVISIIFILLSDLHEARFKLSLTAVHNRNHQKH